MNAQAKAQVFDVLAASFADVDREEWSALTSYAAWSSFIESCEALGREECHELGELLASRELKALRHPISFEAKQRFAAKHFTGGLPASAMPVESLYHVQHGTGKPAYDGPSAAYMRSLIEQMGMKVPDAFKAYPDHLALEADLAAALYRSDPETADAFVSQRFTWLHDFRMKLVMLDDEDKAFYCALIDLALALAECGGARDEREAVHEKKLERK